MGRIVDTDDLIDTAAVAQILGVGSRTVISVYRSRYDDFPAPAVERGTLRLWHRDDVLAWRATHPATARSAD